MIVTGGYSGIGKETVKVGRTLMSFIPPTIFLSARAIPFLPVSALYLYSIYIDIICPDDAFLRSPDLSSTS